MSDDNLDRRHPEHDKLHEKLDKLAGTMEAVLIEQRKTNGRVTSMERDLNGYTVGSRRVSGLIETVAKNQPVVDNVQKLIKSVNVLIVSLLPVLAGTILLLIQQLMSVE